MKISRQTDQQGFAHVLLVIIIVAVLGVIGFVGWKVVSKKATDTAANTVSRAALEAACKETDKNVCKFMASWKSQKYYTVTTKSTSDGTTSESTYQSEGTTKFHLTAKGETPYEMIVLGNDTYTKASNGTWWKQTTKPEETKKFSSAADPSEKVVDDTTADTPESKTTYKNLGKEACGNLTCYKYQVIDSSSPDDKSYIWFDTKDYQLRRTRDEAKDGTVTDSTYSYDKVAITVPSPVKVLGPNQVLVPGQSEPMTLPDASSAQNYVNSLPQGAADSGSADDSGASDTSDQ
jgi:outer membrane lipoprotein-sorting protein